MTTDQSAADIETPPPYCARGRSLYRTAGHVGEVLVRPELCTLAPDQPGHVIHTLAAQLNSAWKMFQPRKVNHVTTILHHGTRASRIILNGMELHGVTDVQINTSLDITRVTITFFAHVGPEDMETRPRAVDSGANGMGAGDRVRCLDTGRLGRLDECLHSGEALVTWDGHGSNVIVDRNRLEPIDD